MSTTDIMYYAWNKDAASLKTAVDAEMSARIAGAYDEMKADVASSMFSATTGIDEQPQSESEAIEGSENENVQTADQ